jgi:hypothetical protein
LLTKKVEERDVLKTAGEGRIPAKLLEGPRDDFSRSGGLQLSRNRYEVVTMRITLCHVFRRSTLFASRYFRDDN